MTRRPTTTGLPGGGASVTLRIIRNDDRRVPSPPSHGRGRDAIEEWLT